MIYSLTIRTLSLSAICSLAFVGWSLHALAQDFSDMGVGQGITNESMTAPATRPQSFAGEEQPLAQPSTNPETGDSYGGSVDAVPRTQTTVDWRYPSVQSPSPSAPPPANVTPSNPPAPPPANVTPSNPPAPPRGAGTVPGQTVKLENPLAGIDSIPDLLAAVLNVFIIIALPIIVFFIMLAGFKYVTARGNPSTIEEATKALTYAILGAILVLGATAIAQILKNLVNAFRS